MSGDPGSSTIRARIMALPEGERLDYALQLLEDLTGDQMALASLAERYRLSATEAKVLAVLDRSFPRMVSRDHLFVSCWGYESPVEDKIVDVYLAKLRRKIGRDRLETRFGQGWRLTERVAA